MPLKPRKKKWLVFVTCSETVEVQSSILKDFQYVNFLNELFWTSNQPFYKISMTNQKFEKK